MAEFAEIRELGAFLPVEVDNFLTDEAETFYAIPRFDEVVAVSKHPDDFCWSRGATSIFDLPTEMLEYFTGFINMDNPRHAHQRRIVAKTFTPTELAGVIDSVEQICTEVIDGFCERGEVDLVEVLSQPFPLMIICDMMGVPRSELGTVLDATNVILGGGDPEFVDEGDPIAALIGAGVQLTGLMTELVEQRRANPTDDLVSKLVHNEAPEDMMQPSEIASFFILLATAGNDTTRNAISHGMDLLSKNPDQRRLWQADIEGVTASAVDEIVRASSPVTFMRRTATRCHGIWPRVPRRRQGRHVLRCRKPRSQGVRPSGDLRCQPRPQPTRRVRRPGPALLPRRPPRPPRDRDDLPRAVPTRLPDIQVSGRSVPLQSVGIPLVAGIKHLPVTFTPTAPVGP